MKMFTGKRSLDLRKAVRRLLQANPDPVREITVSHRSALHAAELTASYREELSVWIS